MLSDSEDSDLQKNRKKYSRQRWANKNEKDAFNDCLLKLVFDRPPLYNYCLPIEDRCASICNKLWLEVAAELEPAYGPLEPEILITRYKYQRDTYTRYRSTIAKQKNSTSQATPKITVPRHLDLLCKLDTLIEDAKTISGNTGVASVTRVSPNVCRTCLIERSNMESIYSTQRVNNEFVKISTMLSLCTGLEFSEYDNFSNVICDSCINAVSLAFEFRSKCWTSHTIQMKHELQNSKNVFKTTSTKRKTNQKRNLDVFISEAEIMEKLKDYVEITLDGTIYRGKRYKCRYCEQKYLLSHLMIEHLENIHKFIIKPDNWLKCPICPRYLPNEYRLSVHARTHKEKKVVICQQCGVTVAKDRFAEHYRRHTGEKPFKCDFCDFRTAQISGMRSHKLTHTGEKPALCHICGQGFRTASQRATHVRKHSDETPYKCIICNKGFKLNECLKRHVETHEPSKMYECKVCNRKFAQKGPHRVHMMQHTGRRPHKCSDCGKGFIQRHCWRIHMKNHHKITVQ